MKTYLLALGFLCFVALLSAFFCRKAGGNKLQDVILLDNVEALASGENPTTRCYGTGSLDCPLNREKVEFTFRFFALYE